VLCISDIGLIIPLVIRLLIFLN